MASVIPISASDTNGFASFVVDDANFVVDALLRQPNSYLATQSLVLLFGPSGTGKTTVGRLLLRACATEHEWSHEQVADITCADFARMVGKAYETNSIPLFRERFAKLDCLLLDDVDDLADRDAAQRELRNLIDSFAMDGRLLLITSRQPPATIKGIEPSLASRLTGSWTLEIKPPGRFARRKIVATLAGQRQLRLSQSAIELIAEHTSGTFLELKSLIASLPEDDAPIDQAAARELLQLGCPEEPTLRTIVKQVAKALDLKVSELRSPSRRQHIVRGRGVAMFLARELTSLSLEQVGKYFGGRDHTTVLHACRRTDELVSTDSSTERQVDLIRDNCKEPQRLV